MAIGCTEQAGPSTQQPPSQPRSSPPTSNPSQAGDHQIFYQTLPELPTKDEFRRQTLDPSGAESMYAAVAQMRHVGTTSIRRNYHLEQEYNGLCEANNGLQEENNGLREANQRLHSKMELLQEQLVQANLNISQMAYQDAVAQAQPPTVTQPPTEHAPPPTGPPPPPTEPATPAHQQATVINTHLSSKLPNPDRLDDGKNPEWDHWYIQMLGKLSANADYNPTEASKLHYIQNRLTRYAVSYVIERLRPGSAKPINTCDEILKVLHRVFEDSNRKTRMGNEFCSLSMQNQTFEHFWAEFQRLSAPLDHSEPHLIDELRHKLFSRMKEVMIHGFTAPTSLHEYAAQCSRAYQQLTEADWSRQQEEHFKQARTNTAWQNGAGEASVAPAVVATGTEVAVRPTRAVNTVVSNPTQLRLTSEEMQQLQMERRCYNCKEVAYHRLCVNPTRPMSWFTTNAAQRGARTVTLARINEVDGGTDGAYPRVEKLDSETENL
ncbi:hypothetical protein MMC07_008712 [Pseudocyphellaria aurata]|nr:hypothetical protein [Pseudocyphellaria aurata]